MAAFWETQFMPDPLSPIFQTGGPLAWMNEDLGFLIIFLLALRALDLLIVKPNLHPKARWFALHACANTVCAVASVPDVYRALVTSPLDCFNGPSYTMVANAMCQAIHMYHCLAFDLRSEDIWHHVMFAGVLCGLSVPFKQQAGASINLGCFFLTGLPGGMDYIWLVLVKQGIIDKMTEKRWCVTMNVWLRGPVMSVYGFLGFQAWWQNTYTTHWILLPIVAGLHFYNGQYYCAQAVATHAVQLERLDVARKDKEEKEAAIKKCG